MQLKAGITALAERQLQRQTKTLKEKEKENICSCKFLSQDGTENAKGVKRQIGITRANAGTKKKKANMFLFICRKATTQDNK